jgi:hypothetical protein
MNVRTLLIPAVIGLGLYAQSNSISLSNNTVELLELVLLLMHQNELEVHRRELEHLNCTVYGTPWGTPPFPAPAAAAPFAAPPFTAGYTM